MLERTRSHRGRLLPIAIVALAGGAIGAAIGSRGAPPRPVEAAEDKVAVGVAFSPGGGIEEALVAEIEAAKREVLVAMYTFTSRSLSQALARAKNRGCDVKVVLDDGQKDIRHGKYADLVKAGLDVRVLKLGKTGDNVPIRMHHKYVVVDRTTVGTGSFNWTSQADEENYENIVIIKAPKTADTFRKEFVKLWDLAGEPEKKK